MEAIEQMRIAGIPVSGVIHVGASDGQERIEYQDAGLKPVIWVEPIDSVFAALEKNLESLDGQIAVKALCSDQQGQSVVFNISNNNGESSSMFDFGHHAELFPHISFESTQQMTTTTVDAILAELKVEPNLLVIDTQGADLKVLQGAISTLTMHANGVFVEVAEVPLYAGGCTLDEIKGFLEPLGFRMRWLQINGMGHGDAFFCKGLGAASDDLTVVEALTLLTPFDVDQRKERVGPPRDGAYVVLPDLMDKQKIFSYGIDGEYTFDLIMASRGHTVMMFDHTIDGIRNLSNDLNLRFIKEGVGGAEDSSLPLNTIENHVRIYADEGEQLILKMDVEGFEYESFDAVPQLTLSRFQQIFFEIHDLRNLGDLMFRRRFVRILRKLNNEFTLFHVHANNYDGENNYGFISGIPVTNLLELSFVRSDLVQRRPSQTLYPTPLDTANVHAYDKKLWFFPFLPSGLGPDAFIAAGRRLDIAAESYAKSVAPS